VPVDWAAWGGAVADNQAHLLPWPAPGCRIQVLPHLPRLRRFTMIGREQLQRALPRLPSPGCRCWYMPNLRPIDAATATLRDADWRKHATYLARVR